MGPMGAIVFLPREGDTPSLMLEHILFDPAAEWMSAALERAGVERFLVVCHDDDRERAGECFPGGTEFVTEGAEDAAGQLTAFLDALEGNVAVFTRPVFLDDEGARRLAAEDELPRGEDFVSAVRTGSHFGKKAGRYEGLLSLENMAPVWDSAQYFARHASIERLRDGLSTHPVRFIDPENAYIGPRVTVGGGTVILPGTILRGRTSVGCFCEIGPNTMIRDCIVGDHVTVNSSQLNESTVEDGVVVGPFAHIRPGCHVGKNVKVGDFVTLKNSTIGQGTKISRLTYVGDSDVGERANLGSGTVTVNYDGTSKYRTVIGDGAFIGCNNSLVAPVKVGNGAYTAAGSTITDDVPADSLAIARNVQIVKKQWAAKRRKRSGR